MSGPPVRLVPSSTVVQGVRRVRAYQRGRTLKRSVLDSLDSAEKGGVLDQLLHGSPDLRAKAELIARQYLAAADNHAVADDVESELLSLSMEDLSGRAGRQRHGHVEPTDAAWQLLEEALQNHDDELARLLDLGMIQPAVAQALGVIGGLYRCRDCEDGDQLLSWAPDFPIEHADQVVGHLTKAGVQLATDSIATVAPEWAAWLTRSTGSGE